MPDMSDLELAEWLEDTLRNYHDDFGEKPDLVGGRYSYVALFGIMLPGQAKLVHDLRVRAEQMIDATPWEKNSEQASRFLRDALAGWVGLMLWAELLHDALDNERD